MDELIAGLGPAEKEIFDISEAWSKAIVANDAEKIGEFMADDWIMVSERGIAGKEYFLSFVRLGLDELSEFFGGFIVLICKAKVSKGS